MFRCQHCGVVVPPHTSVELVVLETRPRVYPLRRKVQRELVWNDILRKREKRDDPGGRGHEIVRQIAVCPPCKRALAPAPDTAQVRHATG
jgi:hypothetical protein